MTLNIFSLEGNLKVTGIPETKAGLEGVTAAGKQVTETLTLAEASLKKMGLTGATLDNAMAGIRRGLGVSGAEATAASGGFAAMAAQQQKAAAIAREMPNPVNAMTAAMGTATSGALAWSSGLANAEKQGLGFRRGLEESHGTIKKHNEGIMGTFESLKHLAEIYGIIKIAEFTKEAIEEAAALQELHQKTGASVEMLSVLTFAGKHAGIGAAELTMSFRGLGLALGNLKSDSEPKVVAAFAAIGLAAKDFKNLNTDEAFTLIVEQLKHLPDGMEKSEVATRIFGRNASTLLPLLDEIGRKGLPQVTEEARKFGAVISEKTAKDAHQLEIEVAQLGFAFDKLERLAIPAITALVQALTSLMSLNLGDWWRNTRRELGTVAAFATGDFGAIHRAMFPGADKEPELAGDPAEMRAARALGKGRPFLPFKKPGKDGGGSTDENPLGTEISLLNEKFELNRAGAADLTRLFVLEGQLEQALDKKNLKMKEELKLARDLAEARSAIAAALAPLEAPDKLAGGQYAPVGQKSRVDLSGYLGGMVVPTAGSGEVSTDDPAYMKGASFMQNLGKGLSDGLAKMRPLANGLTQMFQNIFNHASVGLSIAHFGKTILAGLGSIFVQMAAKAILAAPLFTAIGHAMSNPFTAGPALLAFGLALTALGSAMGGAAHGDGSGGGGGGIGRDQITQIHLTADGAGGFMAPQRSDQPVINVIGHKTAQGARLIAEGTMTARRLGHKV